MAPGLGRFGRQQEEHRARKGVGMEVHVDAARRAVALHPIHDVESAALGPASDRDHDLAGDHATLDDLDPHPLHKAAVLMRGDEPVDDTLLFLQARMADLDEMTIRGNVSEHDFLLWLCLSVLSHPDN